MGFRINLFIILFLFCAYRLFAQPGNYNFTRISSEKGLSNSQINCIYKDQQGFMWFGTMTGLNRYDGYNFKSFRHDNRDSSSLRDNFVANIFEGPENKMWVMGWSSINIYNPNTEKFLHSTTAWLRQNKLPVNGITKVLKDKQGNFWMVHPDQGLFFYDSRLKRTLTFSYSSGQVQSLHSSFVGDIAEDNKGDLWVVYQDGFLEKRRIKDFQVNYTNNSLQLKNFGTNQSYRLFSDAENDLWVYVPEIPKGLYFLDYQNKTMFQFNKQSTKVKLNNDMVRSIAQDNKGKIWIATDHGGINLIDKKDFSVAYLLHNPDNDRSLSQNSVYSVFSDNSGIMWVGTYKAGISYYHPNGIKFRFYKHETLSPNTLPYNDVNRFVEDNKGNLWIGTNGGGLIYFDRKKNIYKQFVHDPANKNSLSNNIVVGLYIDRNQKLWVGTYFGGLNCFDGEKFIHFKHNPKQPGSLSDDRVWDIFEDSRNNLWVGTLGGGLDLFETKNQEFRHYKTGTSNSIHSDYIAKITEDKNGSLWIATAYGVDKLNPNTGKFSHFVNNTNKPKGLSNNNVISVLEDTRGLMWIGTNEGLNLFNKKDRTFRSFRKEDGLPDNSIQGIVEDNKGTIWLTTQNGLSNLIISSSNRNATHTFKFKNYDVSDGLQGNYFNYNAILKTRKGELVLGGSNGFNIFQPDEIKINNKKPKVVFTDFQIYNQSIHAGDTINKRVLFTEAIGKTKEITLKYHENMFSVAFAALDFLQPEKNKYAYRLEGFTEQWLPVDNNVRKITFTNIDPGTYYFHVKASNNDGIWNEKGSSIKITILPPFWKTNLAYTFYALFFLLGLILSRRIIQNQERLKFKLAQERQEAQRRHELDLLKIRFFTNVSHEFRTPLSLILSPIEKILKENPDSGHIPQLQLIQRNARRLLNLVNQLLDFRKMEVQEIALHPSTGDIIPFIKEVAFTFSDLFENKNIQFQFLTQLESLEASFDQDKIEKVLNNLLSNAFKFTPEGGWVTIEVKLEESKFSDTSLSKNLIIQVKDSGIGIPEENQEKIFKRFFQSEIAGSMVNQGSGIGLAITKKFVRLHKGRISVESVPGQGSCFTVILPIVHLKAIEPAITPEAIPIRVLRPSSSEPKISQAKATKKPVILLIEDNEDFRFYLKDNLSLYYEVKEAVNGQQGWQQVLSLLPDLVVSDITMPEMDGLTLNRKIKKDPRTAHIPVILLTANATEDQKLAGYKMGANAYITKPFNFEILLAQIKNLVAQQASYQQAIKPKREVSPQEITITSLDEKLIQKAITIIEKHMSNPDFSVEDLSNELGMSRVNLYKKLLAISDKAPLEFIRTIRLKRAAQLLRESQLTVAEVAYEVGFNNPKYFTKYFKEEFKELPSLYAAKNKEKVS